MITCLLQNRDAIAAYLEGQSYFLSLPTEAEWSKLQVLEKLLAMRERATTLLGGEEYATLSVVLYLVAYFRREIGKKDFRFGRRS